MEPTGSITSTSAVSDAERPQQTEDGCPFCHIAQCYPPFKPQHLPSACDGALRRKAPGHSFETFILLSTPLLLAFLDITPLSRGHLLVCPREHREKLTAVTAREARELGYWLRIVSAAAVMATGTVDFNVVQNNGAAAAQVVPHVHFHVIPRPEIRQQGRWSDQFTMFGRGMRAELDEEDAANLAGRIRDAIARVLEAEESHPKI